MTTQLQPPVAVTPPLPTRRNAELLLLCFAALITVAALLIVQANQERGLRWNLVGYGLIFLVVFGGAHLAIRRFAPYTDPLLLPIVALLNGLGLVMIHRLDLVNNELSGRHHPSATQQMLWTAGRGGRVRVRGHLFERPSTTCALRLHMRTRGSGFLGDPRGAAGIHVRTERRQNLDSLPGLLNSARRVFQDSAADLLLSGADRQTRSVHQRRQAFHGHDPAPPPRPRAAVGGVGDLGRRDGFRKGPWHFAAALRVVSGGGLPRHPALQLGRHRPDAVRRGKRCGVLHFRARPRSGADVVGPVRRSRRQRLSDRAVDVQLCHRRHLRHRARQRSARHRAGGVDRFHHRRIR